MFDFFFYLALFFPALIALLSIMWRIRLLQTWWFATGVSVLSLVLLLVLIVSSYEHSRFNLNYKSVGLHWSSTWQYIVVFHLNNLSAQLLLFSATIFSLSFFLARFEIENSSKKSIALALQASGSLAALASGNLFFYAFFSLCTIIPVVFLIGADVSEKRTSILKYFSYMNMMADLLLMVVALFVHIKFRNEIQGWFKLESRDYLLPPNVLAFILFFVSCMIKLGLFPFHFYRYELYEAKKMDTLIPTITGVGLGFFCMFQFGPQIFPGELKIFSPYLGGMGAISAFIAVISLLRAESVRQRVMQLQLLLSGLIFLGFSSMSRVGLTGAWLMSVFQLLIISMLITLIVISERRVAPFKMSELGRAPLYALHSAYASIAAYGMPISMGFYALVFIFWGACSSMPSIFLFTLICIPLILLSSLKMIFFKIRGGNSMAISSHTQQFQDIDLFEALSMTPIFILLALFGVYPSLILRFVTVTVDQTLQIIGGYL